MRKEIELQIEMNLAKASNIRRNAEEIEKKLKILQNELEKYEKSLQKVEEHIVKIGLREFKGTSVEEPEKRSERINYNVGLQAEKIQYLQKEHPEEASRISEASKALPKDILDLASF